MIFFIIALGRSGTTFLSHLLNKCSDTLVYHEPFKLDVKMYRECFRDPHKSHKYISTIRKEFIEKESSKSLNYGEVNSHLRRHVDALKEEFPNAKFIHLVRNGMDVVRSIYSRKTFTSKDTNRFVVKPRGNWKKQNRLEKICWYWKIENKFISKRIDHFVRFEDLISDYNYFKKNVLDFLGLELSKKIWNKYRSSKINKTNHYKLKWSPRSLKSFNRICRKVMEKYEY